MAEIEINGVHYITQRLHAIDQWHVARKLVPWLVSTMELGRLGEEAAMSGGDVNPQKIDHAMTSVANALSAMSYGDWNFIINICLGAVRRRDPQTGNLRPVILLNGPPEQKASLHFEAEMNGATVVKLTLEVCNSDIIPFLPDLLPSLMGMRTMAPNGAAGEPMMAISGSPAG